VSFSFHHMFSPHVSVFKSELSNLHNITQHS
jgi:hypothetical protein